MSKATVTQLTSAPAGLYILESDGPHADRTQCLILTPALAIAVIRVKDDAVGTYESFHAVAEWDFDAETTVHGNTFHEDHIDTISLVGLDSPQDHPRVGERLKPCASCGAEFNKQSPRMWEADHSVDCRRVPKG